MRRAKQDLESRRAASAAALLGLALALGCGPDPEGKFEDFVKSTRESTSSSSSTSSSTSDGSTSDATTGEPEIFDINGDFLLAVSTTVDRSKPLQFIATNTVTEMDGALTLATCLQPLTLDVGKVLTPREPVGEPLCFSGLPIVDGSFLIDAGEVSVNGLANPITGSNIVATLIMAGSIKSDDLYCGEVSGEVLMPAIGKIDGSSFAAVRLADPSVLPDPVVVDCAGTSVTDAAMPKP